MLYTAAVWWEKLWLLHRSQRSFLSHPSQILTSYALHFDFNSYVEAENGMPWITLRWDKLIAILHIVCLFVLFATQRPLLSSCSKLNFGTCLACNAAHHLSSVWCFSFTAVGQGQKFLLDLLPEMEMPPFLSLTFSNFCGIIVRDTLKWLARDYSKIM